ncbi:uncharacterized protein LOC142984898 [Anticarsia gemmatalis]|uniref:uncharacterized protein LOC142984898 n=1 Tax=Anticarsia gemmatalis TaxID=129554 RepID=UPI003F771235
MIYVHIWTILTLLCLTPANPQFIPFPGLVPMIPPPPPAVQIPLPVPIPIPVIVPENTTTEKPEEPTTPVSIKIVIPWPFGMAPVGPPPMQMPLPFPQIVVMPNRYPNNALESSRSSSSDESSYSSSSSDSFSSESCSESNSYSESDSDSSDEKPRRKRKKRRRKTKYAIKRSNDASKVDSHSEELKPLLTYVSKNGDVKLKWPISKREALLLMHKDDSVEKTKVVHKEENGRKSSGPANVLKRSANNENKTNLVKKYTALKTFQNGNKKLVFKSPDNQKITNFSMSFNVAS